MPDTPDLLASTGQAPSNPFTTVDLSTFSQDDLEARRDLLLAILAQTNNELGVPPMPRAAEATPKEAVADAESKESEESEESEASATEVTEANEDASAATEAADDAPADTVIETEEAAPEKDTRSADADSSADQASSSFFKNLIGGSKAPRSSAQTATLSIAAAVLTVLTVV